MSATRGELRSLARFGWVASIVLGLAVLPAARARAGDIEDFQAARALYEAHDWPRASAAFEALVGGETPRLSSQPLVLESRKYLAATYVFLGREGAAADQIERLLREEPTYELDATQFPREMVQLFDRVRARLAERREAERARRALEEDLSRALEENAALRAELEREIEVEVPRSRWLIQIPFGVGQFENGDEPLGWFFLVGEGIAALGLATTAVLHGAYVAELQNLAEAMGARLDAVQRAIDLLGPMHWSFGGLLGVLAIAGVIEANVAFRPTRRFRAPGRAAPNVQASAPVAQGAAFLTVQF